jgi:hypothetical protein
VRTVAGSRARLFLVIIWLDPRIAGAQILLNTATIKPEYADPRFNLLSGVGLSFVFLIVAGYLKAGR